MAPERYEIRPAEIRDVSALPEVERIAALMFKDHPTDLGIPDSVYEQVTPVDAFAAAQRQGRLWVAVETAGRVIGFALVRELAGFAHLDELDVLPEHGRHGVGSALLALSTEHAELEVAERQRGLRTELRVTMAYNTAG